MAYQCYYCGKEIKGKGQMIYVVAPDVAKMLGFGFDRAYHKPCYKKSEQETIKELGVDVTKEVRA